MAGTMKRRQKARPLAELLGSVLEPVVSRRAAMPYQLLAAWPELVGAENADVTRPLRIRWPRDSSHEASFAPGTLVVACDHGSAIRIQHETGEFLDRINAYLGFQAIERLTIVQRPVGEPNVTGRVETLEPKEEHRLSEILHRIEDEQLRRRLEKLGRGVLRRQKSTGRK